MAAPPEPAPKTIVELPASSRESAAPPPSGPRAPDAPSPGLSMPEPAAPETRSPEPPSSELVAPAVAAPVYYGPLPSVEGFNADEVREFLGPAHMAQQSGAVTAWYYSTPAGRLPVYFIGGVATFSPPAPARRGGAPPAPPVRRPPGRVAFCDGTHAVSGPKQLAIVVPEAPAFIEPRYRQVPLALLALGTRLEVVQPEGAWYLVRFDDERWGTRNGFVHCTAVGEPAPLSSSSPLPSAP